MRNRKQRSVAAHRLIAHSTRYHQTGTYNGRVGTDNSGGSFVSLDPNYYMH
jgi:hypothetical protein